MSSIGLTTAGYYEENAGQLVLDEEKLRKALEKNGDQVVQMFLGGAGSEKGLVTLFRDAFSQARKSIVSSLDTISEKIGDYGDLIVRLEEQYDEISERYYNKFSAMETALARLNSQASFISQLFA